MEVRVTAAPSAAAPMGEGLAKAYAFLDERFHSGESAVAVRHDEHQP